MLFKFSNRIFLLGMALMFTQTIKAQTFNITNTSTGISGSADVEITAAIAAANGGGNVIVNMNAPGYCGVASLPYINITAGTITIQKDPLAIVDQGFAGGSPYGVGSSSAVFNIFSNTVASVAFKSIDILNANTGILIVGCNTFTLDGVRFISIIKGVYFMDGTIVSYTDCVKEVLIQNCEFDNTASCALCVPGIVLGSIVRDNSITNTIPKTFKLLYNTFKTSTAFFNASIDIRTDADYDNLELEIKNNTCIGASGASSRIGTGTTSTWINNSPSNNVNDYLFTLYFENNSLKNLILCSPLSHWKIQNNTLVALEIENPSGIVRNHKVGLIDPGDSYCLNQTYLNNTNTFASGSNSSLDIEGNEGPGCEVTEMTDLDLPSAVFITGNVSVRKCRIQSSSFPNVPIHTSASIGGTLFPTVVSSGSLIAYYTYGGISNTDNNDLYVDFYKSNSNGDLVDYIGEQYIPTGSLIGYNTVTLTIPGGVSLSSSDRVAITMTGLHALAAPYAVAKGTSRAWYPIAPCITPTFSPPAPSCVGPVSFVASSNCVHPQTAMWDFGDGSFGTGGYTTHNYNAEGSYDVTLKVSAPWQLATYTAMNTVTVNLCAPPQTCANCIGSFAPDPGDYVLSLWVKEDSIPVPISYTTPKVNISFTGDPTTYTFGTDNTKNKIIDGWQRIEESFSVPLNATHLNLELINLAGSGGTDAYFDDIRIIPKDGQMKSYVYDPVTLRLSAILDENNYATFYEYDEEGKLLRIKKETERGIMTVQENRENSKKK